MMKRIFKILHLHLFLSIVACTYSNAQNLILNPGFEDGISGWSNNMNNGASANITIETLFSPEGINHLKAEVISLGTNDWDMQLRSNEFAVDESHKYCLTFKAKCDIPASELKVYVQKNSWMGKTFSLSDSWATYSYEFFPDESIKQLKFNLIELTNYYIDDILIEDISPVNNSFNTPPSCVITAPHMNAYFVKGSAVIINAYATDIGGSGIPGEVSKVEFFINEMKIAESTTAENNTYSYSWIAENSGEYLINVVATDTSGKSFTSAGVKISVESNNVEAIGLSAGKGKYLGNVVRNSGVEPSFINYWNAVTSGNGGKWKSVEGTRNVMNWTLADEAYDLAMDYHLPYRYHTLAWGSQYPSWITALAPSQFQAEMDQFIKAVADRYPYIDQIDVLNEALPGHQEDTKYFIDGLGGTGVSGYDWAVWLFKKAREYFPNAKLILNDFGMVNSSINICEQLLLLKVLRDSALVDGFGAQAHTFSLDKMQAVDLQQNLDLMASAGVPIYITEMDMEGNNTDEATQLASYQELFPVLWEHPDVAGISLWGYIFGDMWRPNAGLVNSNGTERSSMLWLKNYMNEQEDLGYPFGLNEPSLVAASEKKEIKVKVYPNPAKGMVTLSNVSGKNQHISICDVSGRLVDQFEIYPYSNLVRNLSAGFYLVNINNRSSITLVIK